MKKTIYFLYLLGLFLTCKNVNAQVPGFTMNPNSQCYSAGNNTAIAYVTNATPGATSYTWTVLSPSACLASVTTYSNNMIASIHFSCCGVYTVNLKAYDSTHVVLSSTSQTAVVYCSGVYVSGNSNVCLGNSTTLTAGGANSYTWMTTAGTFTGSSIVLTPSATTCYTVVGLGGAGCISYAAGCVYVTPGSSVSISGNGSICGNSSTILYASGGTSYTWMPGGLISSSIVVSPSVSTCYTVAGLGCSGVSYAVKCVSVGVAPVISVSGNTTICAGQSATLVASGASSYTWMTSSGMTYTGSAIVLTPSVTTCYTVLAKTSSGCTGYTWGCLTIVPGGNVSISGNANLCGNGSTILSASGATSYTWFPGGSTSPTIVASPSVSTCYTLIGQGCSGLTAAVKCLTVGSTPVVSISGNTICAGDTAIVTASGASSYTWYTSSGTFTGSTVVLYPTSTTCFSLIASNGPGCTSYTGACVFVTPGGNVSISGNANVCGGSTTLYANGATSYTWLPGGMTSPTIVVSPTATTCYTLLGNTCSGISAAVQCVTVGTTFSINVTGNTNICPGTGATLTANGATSYTWFTSMGTFTGSTIVLTPSATACYSLIGTNPFGCTGYAGGCVSVTPGSNVTINGNASICGGSTILYGSGATSYTWFPGGITSPSIVVSPMSTTCYTLMGYSSCAGITAAVKCVTVATSLTVNVTGNTNICPGTGATLTANGASSYTWITTMGTFTGSTIVLTPSATACYTVVGSNTQGCTGYVTGCVNVNQGGNVWISGNTNICNGSTVLSANGATSYTWLPGGMTSPTIVVTPTASTCYTLIGNNGCGGTSSAVHCMTVGTSFSISVSGNTNICPGTGATLTASGASSYTWFTSMGTFTGSTIVLTPSATACYSLIGTGFMGCTGYAGGCVTVSQGSNVAISGNANICGSGSTILTASGATSYTWFPGGSNSPTIVASPSVATCYTLMGYSSCAGITAAVKCLTVGSTPVVSISGNTICAGGTATVTASGASSYTWYTSGGMQSGSSIILTPTATTCFSLIASNGPGCTSYTGACVFVTPVNNPVVTGSSSLCAGSSAVLSASGASSYTWLPGNLTGSMITVTPSASICYTVVGTNANGCVSLANKCIQVVPKPTIVTVNSGILCAGNMATLTASGATSYTWLPFNQTGSSIVITPSVSTCYTVIGANGNGCKNSVVGCFSVMPTPVINVFGTDSICAGGSATLTATGAASYTWLPANLNGANIVVSPSSSTCYTVLGSSFGCIGAAVKCVNVTQGAFINVSGPNSICAGSPANLLAFGATTYTWNTGSNSPFLTVTPSVSTCYTVTGTTSQGCIGAAVKCISVQPAPSLFIGGPNAICAGAGTTLTASGASSYTWSTGATGSGIFVAPSASTVYTVYGSNGGCTSSKSFTLMVNPKPNIYIYSTDSISGNDSIICAGTAVHLVAGGADTYTWSTGSTSSFITVTPSVTTSYTVSGMSSNSGCINSNVITLIVSQCTGLSKNSGNLQIDMYPNPSTGKLTLQGNGVNTIRYSVYDMIGRELIKGDYTDTKQVDLSGYANGTYIVRFEMGGSVSYKKLVLENK